MFKRDRNRQAFETEALPHLDALYALALRLTHDPADAEDLVQDTLVKAFRFFHHYEQGSNAKAWLFKVMVNLFYNDRRKAKKDKKLAADLASEAHAMAPLPGAQLAPLRLEPLLGDPLLGQQLQSALEALPDEFRLAILLCDVYELRYREIAEVLGCPVGTVMSRLYRGRRLMQGTLHQVALERGLIQPTGNDPAHAADLSAYRAARGHREGQ